ARLSGAQGTGFTRKKLESNIKPVKIVGGEGRLQNTSNLFVVASRFEFLSGSPNGKVVDHDLALFERALGNTTQFTHLKIAQALDAHPDAGSKHGENQAQGAAGGPKQKQAEESEHGGDRIKHNHDLTMGEAVLQQLVMDMLTVSRKNGAPADQAPENRERLFQNRQAEGNNGNGNRDNGGGLLRSCQSERAQQEADEKTARISEKDGRRIEVVT